MKDYFISTEKKLLSEFKVWSLLKDCYWSRNIPIEYVKRFINYSLCFGVYQKNSKELVGFGRVISDYTTYAYVCDIVIDPEHRRKKIGSELFSAMKNHPELRGLKTWTLRTSPPAKQIYEKHGFQIIDNPETQLEINDLEIYCHANFVNLYMDTICADVNLLKEKFK